MVKGFDGGALPILYHEKTAREAMGEENRERVPQKYLE